MSKNAEELMYLMSAKVLHDLASPIGSIGMAIDSIEDDSIRAMLEESYFSCDFKLKFYRMVFSYSPHGPSWQEGISLLKRYADYKKISIDGYNAVRTITPPEGDASRLLLGLTFVCMESLIGGGQCELSVNQAGFFIKVSGPICRIRDGYHKLLKSSDVESVEKIDPQNIFVYFLVMLGKKNNNAILFEKQDNAISLCIR